MSRLRLLPVLIALLATGVLLSACGSSDSVPGNAVARVKDQTISTAQFNHWVQIAALSQAAQSGTTTKPNIPVPPNYTACIANLKKAIPAKLPKGQKAPTDAQLKAQCAQQYSQLRDQVLSFLISSAWIQGEAKKQGVDVTDAQVQAEFAKQKKQSYPKEADFQKFLKSSGMSQTDLLYRVKIDLLSQKIRDKVTKGKNVVTDAQVKAYYNKNKAKFGTPESRNVNLILTKTEAQANAAKKALTAGAAFKTVATKYSIDQATKANGGVLTGVTKGQQDKTLDAAIFSAKKGVIVGPVKTQFGYYIVQVTKITPAIQQTLQQASPAIKTQLQSTGQQTALDKFVKTFQASWKKDTNCRKGYVVTQCKNAPKAKTTTTATTAAPAQ